MSNRERVKDIRRESDTTVGDRRLESHHLFQKHNGGGEEIDNLFGLLVSEHAIIHKREAELATSTGEKRANWWSVNIILSRMTPEEKKEFFEMNDVIRRRR